MTLQDRIKARTDRIGTIPLVSIFGQVLDIEGQTIKATLLRAQFGQLCTIDRIDATPLKAEVIAISGYVVTLNAYGDKNGVVVGAKVTPIKGGLSLRLCDAVLGRVIDALGRPIDGLGPYSQNGTAMKIRGTSPAAMSRPIISSVFHTGVRTVDIFNTLGRGQRIGVFGPPGTGKTSLLGMLARNCKADVVVIGLIGERGREVREFIEEVMPADMRQSTVVVAATSDRPASERAVCAHSATTVAEYFRDQGKSVFLLIDSMTRAARALREIGLAAGEAPTRRGYPSSVYPALPLIIERAGRAARGDITAIYTVLTEGDMESDPIAEEVKSLTDGHLLLDRKLAEKGHYPALNVLGSLSRSMSRVATQDHVNRANKIRAQLAKYEEIELLLQVGEYAKGADQEADDAIENRDAVNAILRQSADDVPTWNECFAALKAVTA